MSLVEIPDELASRIREAARLEGRDYQEFVRSELEAAVRRSQPEALTDGNQEPETVVGERPAVEDVPSYLAAFLETSEALKKAGVELPSDGSINVDHYLYGAPKRTL